MKKFKTGLLAFALMLGVSGAFVAKIHAAPKKADLTYNWSRTNGVAQPDEVDPLENATIEEAQANYGCTTGSSICATGVPTAGGDNATIRFN